VVACEALNLKCNHFSEGKGVRAPVIEGYSYRKGLPA
jgi:hypothetical protein